MRPALLLSFCVAAAGCGPAFSVVPQGGARLYTAHASGVMLTAFADQWEADPRDLADHLTPIAVDLYNGTGTEVRVSLADFGLHSDDGTSLQPLNPFALPDAEGDSRSLVTGPFLAGPLVGPTGGILLASGHGGGGRGGGGSRGGGFGRGGAFVSAPSARRGGYSSSYGRRGAYGGSPRWGRGFYVAGGLRGYYGPGALYWGGPWLYAPGYDAYGWYGDGTRYEPSPDVLELALPEGVLAPGARVNGYLYFRKATAEHVRQLLLTWEPHDARSGTGLGQARIELDVIHH